MDTKYGSFYSKLVRLKGELVAYTKDYDLKFLFQIGSIKRDQKCKKLKSLGQVSIPNWFD